MKHLFSLSHSEEYIHSFWGFHLLTWFGCGLSPIAPGTVGSLGALVPAAAIMWLLGPDHGRWSLLAAAFVVCILGCRFSSYYVAQTGRKDPGEIVIDEVVGQWLVLCVAPATVWGWGAAFLAFRAADILKPFPVSFIDRTVKGGLGIMGDDLVAAAYAAACVLLLSHFSLI